MTQSEVNYDAVALAKDLASARRRREREATEAAERAKAEVAEVKRLIWELAPQVEVFAQVKNDGEMFVVGRRWLNVYVNGQSLVAQFRNRIDEGQEEKYKVHLPEADSEEWVWRFEGEVLTSVQVAHRLLSNLLQLVDDDEQGRGGKHPSHVW